MTIYASKVHQGFFDDGIHRDLPADAQPISTDYHAELLAAQANGLLIDWSGDLPVAVELTLQQHADVACALITQERNRREATVFQYRGKAIDCDPRAVQRITAAALAAQAALATGQPFTLDWTCADNSVLTLDAAGVAGMPVALAIYADALHRHARSLKQAVLEAEDMAALAAIDIQTGWPEQ